MLQKVPVGIYLWKCILGGHCCNWWNNFGRHWYRWSDGQVRGQNWPPAKMVLYWTSFYCLISL